VGVDRRVVDQHAVALLAEAGQHRPGPVHVAEEIGLQYPPEGLGWSRLQQAEQVDTGVVDPDVESTEPLHGTSGQLGHGRLVGGVGGHGQGLAAGCLALPCQFLQGVDPARGQHHPRPPLGEPVAQSRSNPASSVTAARPMNTRS
jgi:hypothetical protein